MHDRTTKEWQEADKKTIWHPFTQMRDWLSEDPLVIAEAKGFHLIDSEGKRYIDGHSSLWVNVHGHGHPAITAAIAEQAARLDHSTMLGLASSPSIELAERLVDLTPEGLSRVFYSDSGSTSVEIALKMSFQYWQQKGQQDRTRFVCFRDGYHGDTIGSVSVGGISLFHEIFHSLLFKTETVPFPYAYRDEQNQDDEQACTDATLAALEKVLASQAGQICAVVSEPGIQGAAGMHTAAPGYLKSLRALCDRYQVHLILDEVATGFGRTETLFACEQDEITPDFLCLAKGLTGGILPLAATMTTEEVFDGFLAAYEDYKAFFHGHSFTGNPIACAAALASLDLFEKDKIIAKSGEGIARFRGLLEPLSRHKHVGEIRQRGWMTGIELVQDRGSRSIWTADQKIPQKVTEAARQRGAIIRPLGNVMILMPAPAIDQQTLAELVTITHEAIDVVTTQAE